MKFHFKKRALPILFSLAFTALGACFVYYIWTDYSDKVHQHTVDLAKTVGSVLSVGDVEQLTGNADDLSKQAYTDVKNHLMRIKADNGDIHTAYLIKTSNGGLVYLANSEPPAAEGYAPPGSAYTQSLEDAEQAFSTGLSDMSDIGQNEWVSALVPLVDARTGKTVAVFGADFSAALLANEIRTHVFHAVAMVIAIALLFIILYITIMKNRALQRLSNRLERRETLFRTMYEQAPVGIAIYQDKTLISDINTMFETILGRTKKELSSIDWTAYTHPDDLKADLENFRKMQAGEIAGYSMKKRCIRPDGSVVWVNMNVAPLRTGDGEGTPTDHLCIIQDITKRVEAERSLLESERSKSVLLSNLPGMAYRCRFDKNWTMEFVSDGCKKLTGYAPDELMNNGYLTYYDLILPQYREVLWREWLSVLALKVSFQYEYEIKTADGGDRWVLELGQGIYDDTGKVSAIEGIVVDISESKAHEAQIRHMHDHDPLTGLYNRGYFDREIKRLNQTGILPVTLLLMDISGLRLINDAFGHTEGDSLIVTVANILKRCRRRGDILASVGGDTFAMLMPHADNEAAHGMRIAILDACRQHNKTSDKPYDIDVSIGYATRQSLGTSMQQVSAEAETFLRNNKLLNRRSSYSAILSSIMATVYEKSHETKEHAQRIADLCQIIGEKLSLSDKDIDELLLFAMLHDVGKIAVPDEILNKQELLTEQDWEILKKHPETGYRIAKSTPELTPIADYILSHHERWDGKGYPQGLSGNNIPLLSRILAVADAYDAMTQERPYHNAISKQEAVAEIRRNANKQFDPQVVRVFEKIMLESDFETRQEVIAH